MYLADYHMHSRVSPDADFSMADMARAAHEMGMQEICFTEHVDFAPTWGGWKKTHELFRWEDLQKERVRSLPQAPEGVELRSGIEIGDPFWDLPRAEHVIAEAPALDYTLGSIHVFSPAMDGADISHYVPADEADARRAIEDYIRQVYELAKWGRFTVLAHLTLPLRYFNERRGYSLTFDPWADEVEEILRLAVDRGLGLELNTNKGNAPLPGERWLRRFRELGGEIVTLGTDAHAPNAVGRGIREGQELLRRCGFRRFCTYRLGQPQWHEL